MLRVSESVESIVCGSTEVVDGVEESAVEVEYYE
jgi:hypothetical protein